MTGQWLVKSGHMWAFTPDSGHRTESGLCLGAISTLTQWDWVHLHYSVYRGFFILQNVFVFLRGGGSILYISLLPGTSPVIQLTSQGSDFPGIA